MTTAIIATGFNGVQFQEITRNNEPWIRGYQVGTALGYTNPDVAIRKIYDRHADEFTDSMTAVITLPTPGGPQETRIFSLRGCHLLAMFARTSVAKAFRVWVLDVLETLNKVEARQQPLLTDSPITPDQQCTLQSMVKALVDRGGIYANIWSRFNNHFRIAKYSQLPQSRMSEAVDYLMRLEIAPKALPAVSQSLSAALRIKALNPGPGNSGEFYEGELLRVFQDFVEWRKEILAQVDTLEKRFSGVTSLLFRDVLHKLMAGTPMYMTDMGIWAMHESRDDAVKAIRDGVNKWEGLFVKAEWFAKTLRVRW